MTSRGFIAVFLAVLALAGCGGGQMRSEGPATSAMPEPLDGEALLQRTCTACHDLGGVAGYADFWGEDEWRDMVETMVGYGAVLTPDEFEILVEYLAATY